MSVQRHSFFALKSSTGYWAEIPPIPKFSLCGGNPFTISTTFWYEHAGSEGIFLNQGDIFTFGTKNGYAYFTAKNLGTFVTNAFREPKLEEKEWNRIDVVYDGKTVKIFIQGLLASETPSTGASYVDSTTQLVIGNMEGYLGEIAVYNKAISDADILCMDFSNNLSLEDKELYIDFNVFKPDDEGKHKLALRLMGGCCSVNLVNALKPMPTGFAMPYGSGLPNPGAFPTNEMTIYAMIYPMQLSKTELAAYENILPSDDDVFIFTNGNAEDTQNVALGLSLTTGKPFLILGKVRYDFSFGVKRAEWTQVGVTMKDNDLTFYINDKPAGGVKLAQAFTRSNPASLVIGNQFENETANRGFRGYIDSVALFNKAISAERMKGYADIAPYRFDDDLIAMWVFHEQKPIEILTGAKLVYDETVNFDYRENTVLNDTLPIMTFALPDTETKLDDVDQWATRVVAETITQTIKSFTGCEPVNGFVDPEHKQLNGTLEKYLSENLMQNSSIMNTVESGELTVKDCARIFGAMVSGAVIGGIIYTFYVWGSSNAVRRGMFLQRFLRYFSIIMKTSKIPIITGGIAGAATAVEIFIEKCPAPDAGTCTSEDYTLNIQSLSFYNQTTKDAGALFALADYDKEPQLPEWQNVDTGVVSADVLYHRDIPVDKTPSVTMKFHCTLACDIPIDLTIKATCMDVKTNGALLGVPAAQTIHITHTGDYTITFPLPDHKLRGAELKAHKVVWQWLAFSSKIGEKLIGKSEHFVYVLSSKPVLPWTTELKSSNPPTYPVIYLCEKITSLTTSETEGNRRFASQFVKWSHSGEGIFADEWEKGSTYSRWDREHYQLTFNAKSLMKKIATGCVAIGHLDCACLSFLLSRLHGFDKLCITEITPLWENEVLFLRDVKRVGAASVEKCILLNTYNAIGIANSDKMPEIWDPFITLSNAAENGKMLTISGLLFSKKDLKMDIIAKADDKYYRSLLCKAGSSCNVALMCNYITIGELPLTTIVPDNLNFAKVIPGRQPFDNYVKDNIRLPVGYARCHSISYKSIETMCTDALNALAKKEIDIEEFKDTMHCLWEAVTVYKESKVLDAFESNALESINHLCDNLCDNHQSDDEWIIAQINRIVYLFNSTLANLRVGKSDWNSSIGEFFDPTEWVYVVGGYVGIGSIYYIAAYQDNFFMDLQEISNIHGAEIKAPGFYLTSVDDTIRLNNLCSKKLLKKGLTFRKFVLPNTDFLINSISDCRVRILCSSSNYCDLKDLEYMQNNALTNTFYLNMDENKWKIVGW